MEKIWHKSYPKGVEREIDLTQYNSIKHMIEESFKKYGPLKCITCMGVSITYSQLDKLSKDFGSFLQNETNLKKGDSIALQMPNVLQYQIALFGAIRAGLKVVNTNPLYSEREMLHQFKDSGAKAIVILSNFADKLEDVLADTKIETVILTELGDMLGFPKKLLVNTVVKHVKKMVPKYNLPQAISFKKALEMGSKKPLQNVAVDQDEVAFLQYTGGTTGVSKGAMLTHRNILANCLQIVAWMKPSLKEREEIVVTPLPLYHIFSLTVNCCAMMCYGAESILIPNPRDLDGFIKSLKKSNTTLLTGVNTLFNGLMNHPEFTSIDWSNLKVVVAGGMALQSSVGQRWEDLTGCRISEGYGLTESSPVLTVNPLDATGKYGSIGIPVSSTELKIVGEQGQELGIGEAGEICGRGPQVMKGYWQRPEETKDVIDADGWLHTGDIGIMDEFGFTKIVDRKKDMILVSGFNVYPNEVEDVIASMEGVDEVAAVGVADEKSGEVVKVFIVKKQESLTEELVISYCRDNLAGYKIPRHIEFRDDLPKSNVGKILRRMLRDGAS